MRKKTSNFAQGRDSHNCVADPVGTANHYIFRGEVIHRLRTRRFSIFHLTFANSSLKCTVKPGCAWVFAIELSASEPEAVATGQKLNVHYSRYAVTSRKGLSDVERWAGR